MRSAAPNHRPRVEPDSWKMIETLVSRLRSQGSSFADDGDDFGIVEAVLLHWALCLCVFGFYKLLDGWKGGRS